jgi:hypothetical protein
MLRALPVLLLALLPAAEACSLVRPDDLQATWLGRDALVTNVGDRFVRIGFDGTVSGLHRVELQAWRAPAVDPDGRWMALDDQRGLGADCSGDSYTLLLDARNGTLADSWRPALRVAAGTEQGFLAFDGGWRLHAWEGGSPRRLGTEVERAGVGPAVAGDRFAWLAEDGGIRVTRLADGGTERRWEVAPHDVRALAMDQEGRVAALTTRYLDGTGTTELLVEGRPAWSSPEGGSLGPHALVAFDGGWLFTNGTAAWFVEPGGQARVVATGPRIPAVAVDADGARAAVAVVDAEGRAVEMRLLLPSLVPGPVLRPGPAGWEVEAPQHAPSGAGPGTKGAAAPGAALMLLAALAALLLARHRPLA